MWLKVVELVMRQGREVEARCDNAMAMMLSNVV
jgi:hypothetical protein